MAASKLCRHLMPTGRTCHSPAMAGSAWCYYHGPKAAPHRAARKTPQPVEDELDLVPASEPSCIDLNSQRILFALASNRISVGRATTMLQCLQTSLASIREQRQFDLDMADAGVTYATALEETPPAN